MSAHVAVLRDEAVAALRIKEDGVYVDATFGRGGHAQSILGHLGPQGRLLAFDRDPDAVAFARARFGADPRFEIEQGSFSMLGEQIARRGLMGRVDGVLFDLGVSSPQLENPSRGFSFRHEGPLDMRMDPARGESAAQWLSRASEQEIADTLFTLGEERYARRIARAIVAERQVSPIETTAQLAAIVKAAVPTRERHKDPATRTFQAIRLRVNAELDEISAALPQTLRVLGRGGRLVVISFHSLEDRVVKQFLRKHSRGPELPPELPVRASEMDAPLRLIGRAQKPSREEVRVNPRARSAVMRVAQRTEVALV